MIDQTKTIPELDPVISLTNQDLLIVHQGALDGIGGETKKATFALLREALLGASGSTAREVELRNNGLYLQWRYIGDSNWINLVSVSSITGAIGATGATGSIGLRGFTGSTGATGDLGGTGATGNAGKDGDTGATGASGVSDRYQTFSYTPLTIGDGVNGQQFLTVEAGLSYTINQNLLISHPSEAGKHMHGTVDSYDASTGDLVVNIVYHSGIGNYSNWVINLDGAVGVTGSTGATGVPGATGAGATGATGLTGATGPAGTNFTVHSNSGLEYQNNVLTTIYNTLIADSVSSVAVGGAATAQAAAWKIKSLVDVLDTILFPDQLPTYTVPTITITSTQSGELEVGTPINQTITVTATENDAGAFSYLSINRNGSSIYNTNSPSMQAATDIASQYGFDDPNNPNRKYVVSHTDTTGTITTSTISWNSTGNHAAGLAKNNNKGITDTRAAGYSTGVPQAARTGLTSSTVSVQGIYPYFYGKSSTAPSAASIAADIADNAAHKVLANGDGNITVTFNASAEYVWLAVHEDYQLKNKWYNTGLNNGNIGNGQFILAPAQYAIDSPQSLWSGETYNIYISSGATSTEGSLIFQN
jgi:hypothetical protein